jgi:hypothetical protein
LTFAPTRDTLSPMNQSAIQPDVQSQVNHLVDLIQAPFYHRPDFWIFLFLTVAGLTVGAFGLWYSIQAFKEAQQAKVEATQAKAAAREAGKSVRVQTAAIEIGEISQKLVRLHPTIRFSEASELLNEVSRKLLRSVAPYLEDPILKTKIASVRPTIEAAQASMQRVLPTPGEEEVSGSVYTGVQADFAALNNLVAELVGLFEARSFDSGEKHV